STSHKRHPSPSSFTSTSFARKGSRNSGRSAELAWHGHLSLRSCPVYHPSAICSCARIQQIAAAPTRKGSAPAGRSINYLPSACRYTLLHTVSATMTYKGCSSGSNSSPRRKSLPWRSRRKMGEKTRGKERSWARRTSQRAKIRTLGGR
ncbi:unnamed protein product, partial [Hapterophycus canaliculatus]